MRWISVMVRVRFRVRFRVRARVRVRVRLVIYYCVNALKIALLYIFAGDRLTLSADISGMKHARDPRFKPLEAQ